MRNTITLALVTLAGAALAAQSPTSQSSSSQASTHGSATVVTGCLSAGPNDTFTLTAPDSNASSSSAKNPTGTTGTTATTPAGRKVVKTITYTLAPGANVDLKAHVGHKVQVSGTATPAQASVTSSDSRTGTSAGSQGTSGAKPTVSTTAQAQIVARQLSVDSIKMVADKCDILK